MSHRLNVLGETVEAKAGDRVKSLDDGRIGTIHEVGEGYSFVIWQDNSADWDDNITILMPHEEAQMFLDSMSAASELYPGLELRQKALMMLVAATTGYRLAGVGLDGVLRIVKNLWESNEQAPTEKH